MPIPVDVPKTPLLVTEEQNALGESLLQAILQVVYAGTSGASAQTPPQLIPVPNTEDQYQPILLDSPQSQLFYRHLSIAIAARIAGGSSGSSPQPIDFLAACSVSDGPGMAVRAVDGITRTVTRADPTILEGGKVVGVIASKPTPTTALVRTYGPIEGVFEDLEAGRPYVLGSNGRLTREPPIPKPGEDVFTQEVGVALDRKTLLVCIDPRRHVKTGEELK